MKSEKGLNIEFQTFLSESETETETYGCQAKNPDNVSLENVCVFVSQDCLCKKSFFCVEKTI